MTRMLKICPFCGSGQLYRRCRGLTGSNKYKCMKCGSSFQKPNYRELNYEVKKGRPPAASRMSEN